MPVRRPRGRWWRWRIAWRWCRIGFLALLLLLILAAWYLNRAGLPEPFKAMVQGALLDRGLAVEFARLRLLWYRGLVADEVKGRRAGIEGTPHVEFREVALNLDWPALLQRRVEVRALGFREGRLTLPVQPTNAPLDEAVLDVDAARLEFGADDTWSLEEFAARFEGVALSARGLITHGSSLPLQVKAASGSAAPRRAGGWLWRTQLRTLKRQLGRVQCAAPPEVRLTFRGDGRDLGSFRSEIRCAGGGASTPWGELRQFNLQVQAAPAGPDRGRQRLEFRLEAAGAATPWGSLQGAHAQAVVFQPFTNALPDRLEWDLRADELRTARLAVRAARLNATSTRLAQTPDGCHTDFEFVAAGVECPWGTCGESRLAGQARHSFTNAVPEHLEARLELGRLAAGEHRLMHAEADLRLRRAAAAPGSQEPVLGFWRHLAELEGDLSLRAGGLELPQLRLDTLAGGVHWAFPGLELTNVTVALYDGQLTLHEAQVDVRTREARTRLAVDFDVRRLDRVLPAGALKWLAQFQYASPPHADAAARVILPPWTGASGNVALDLRKSLELRVRVDGRDVAFNGLSAPRAGVTVTISNEVLRLRDLSVWRPEGRADLSYDLDLARRDFRWRIESRLDAQDAAPAVDPVLPDIVRLFSFSSPPAVTGEVWGNWNPPKVVDFALHLAATNFTFRGEPFLALEGTLAKHGAQLTATEVRIQHATGEASVPGVGYDVAEHWVTLTNARSLLDPLVAARCINPVLEETLKPYRFVAPPTIEANGQVHAGGTTAGSDLRLAVQGGPFAYWRFNSRNVSATVRWTGERVGVTNIACEFYRGRLSGEFVLDLPPGDEPHFNFQARGTDFDLQGLLHDTIETTNHITGTVTGTLVVTNALISDWSSWHGYGQARMRDGMLWDLPILGMLSKVMNVLVPGIGNSRATAAQGHYTITRSVIHTDDLHIDAGPARLQYVGTVDFDGNVEARVIAEVLQTTPVIGPFISLLFSPASKALEFKVTGTLGNPVLKPVYVPRFLLPLLNPIGTVESILSPKAPPSRTKSE